MAHGELPGGDAHRFRVQSIEELLARRVPVKLWGFGLSRLRRLSPFDRMGRAYQGEAWGLAMYRTLARSRITLNFHIDVAKSAGFAGNMRIYEATGCGALLLTDTAPGLERLLVPGREIETWSTLGELEEKVRHYLAHPEEREAIARAGQRACLERHGYATRVRELERILLG